jgi:hypothetical protein
MINSCQFNSKEYKKHPLKLEDKEVSKDIISWIKSIIENYFLRY